jgi:hypothetical protein
MILTLRSLNNLFSGQRVVKNIIRHTKILFSSIGEQSPPILDRAATLLPYALDLAEQRKRMPVRKPGNKIYDLPQHIIYILRVF